jgi:hypothetical protein
MNEKLKIKVFHKDGHEVTPLDIVEQDIKDNGSEHDTNHDYYFAIDENSNLAVIDGATSSIFSVHGYDYELSLEGAK